MKTQYRLLSYELSPDTYEYGGKKSLTIKQKRAISRGDTCNTFILNLPNHIGTHIDCPNHFFASGKKLSQYKIKDFIFSKPAILNCPKQENGLITLDDIRGNLKKLKKKDILLLRTGFYKYRSSIQYAIKNPGIDPEVARFIRKNLPNIRCIGVDSISVSSYGNRKIGRETHRIFLQKHSFKGQPVCIIEDMDLSGYLMDLKKVFVVPLFIKGADSAPCTIFAF
ncbi:cyclase family protein [Candidatus Omnitrophota bacterium]